MSRTKSDAARALRMPTREELELAYRRDLSAAFPPEELKPLRGITAALERGQYLPWCLFESGEIVGECFLWTVEPGWALLDYLCVAEGQRNRGLGAEILQRLRAALPDTVILGEAEAPEDAPDPALAERRLGFYRRTGARTAGVDTDIFGVHYRTLYWAVRAYPDGELSQRHAAIYRTGFTPEGYAKFIRIPRDPASPSSPPTPWEM